MLKRTKIPLGARLVSGYLFDPENDLVGSAGTGFTQAWVEIYILGAGWLTFDPTNRGLGSKNLTPVAVARDIRQAVLVAGSFVGASDALIGMSVEVSVSTEGWHLGQTGSAPASGAAAA